MNTWEILKMIVIAVFGDVHTEGNYRRAATLLEKALSRMLHGMRPRTLAVARRELASALHLMNIDLADSTLHIFNTVGLTSESPIASEATRVGTRLAYNMDGIEELHSSVAAILGATLWIFEGASVVDSDALVRKASELTQAGVGWALSFGHDGECSHFIMLLWKDEGDRKGVVAHCIATTELHELLDDDLMAWYCSQRPRQ